MTLAEIVESEKSNTGFVMLYKEGMFFKAYEKSAFLVYNYIFPFKLSKKYIKIVGCDIISLGFPINTLPKWFHGREYSFSPDGNTVFCRMKETLSFDEFFNWKSTVEVNVSKRFTPQTSSIEKSPLYKKCYDLVIEVYSISRHFSKNVRDPLGVRLKLKTYQLCYLIRFYYECPEDKKTEWVLKAMSLIKEVEYILQILKDLNEINLSHYSICSEYLSSASKQLGLLHRKVKAKVDAV